MAASAPAAHRHCLLGLLFTPSVMFLVTVILFVLSPQGTWRETCILPLPIGKVGYISLIGGSQGYGVVGHIEGKCQIARPPPPRIL